MHAWCDRGVKEESDRVVVVVMLVGMAKRLKLQQWSITFIPFHFKIQNKLENGWLDWMGWEECRGGASEQQNTGDDAFEKYYIN